MTGRRFRPMRKPKLTHRMVEQAIEMKSQWTAAAWLLERKYPDEYAQTTRRVETEGEDVPQITLGVELKVARSSDGDD
jgi:hypothetical protein